MIKVPILSSLNGEQISEQELDRCIFGLPYRPDILKCVIDWQLAKRRAGTHSTRTIAHVSGTKAKPYKQKGTGRARHGSLRAPQFRGGAVIFGPVLRSHAYALNKKIRKKALQTALSYKISFGKLFIIDDLLQISAKTRDLNNILCKICSKSILMVDSIVSDTLRLSSSNLKNVDVLPVIGLNTYDVMRHSCVIINKNALKALEDRLL